jgi:protein-disulfide isomerase/uncharacterized membrane protein
MRRAKIVLIVLALLTLAGIADSVYLTYDHYAAIADPDYGGGLCGEAGGCNISRSHAASEIPLGLFGFGLPIAILGLAFYLGFGVLTVARARKPDDRTPRRLQFALAIGAVLYSIVLAAISLGAQGSLCDFCAILYGINLLLFGVTLWSLGESPGEWLRGVGSAIRSRLGLLTAAIFVVVTAGTYVAYAAGLSSAMTAQAQSQNSDEPGVDIDVSDRPSKGPESPKIHIIEISDFECPFCRRLYETVEGFRADYPDDVRVTFLNFPLDKSCNPMMPREFHKNACYYASLAICADKQPEGDFFRTAALLFGLSKDVSRDDVLTQVADGGLDAEALKTCVDAQETKDAITKDLMIGAKLKVTGTPALIVNGKKVSGDKPRAFFDEVAVEAGIKLKE